MTDYMNEAERLISAHEWAIRQHDRGAEWDDVWADHAAALDRARERISQAALRGEVKP